MAILQLYKQLFKTLLLCVVFVHQVSGDSVFYLPSDELSMKTKYEYVSESKAYNDAACPGQSRLADILDAKTLQSVSDGLQRLFQNKQLVRPREIWTGSRTALVPVGRNLNPDEVTEISGSHCVILSSYDLATDMYDYPDYRLFPKPCIFGERPYLCKYPPEGVATFFVQTGEGLQRKFEYYHGEFMYPEAVCLHGAELAVIQSEATLDGVVKGLASLQGSGQGHSNELWVGGRADTPRGSELITPADVMLSGPHCVILSDFNVATRQHDYHGYRLFAKNCGHQFGKAYLCQYPTEKINSSITSMTSRGSTSMTDRGDVRVWIGVTVAVVAVCCLIGIVGTIIYKKRSSRLNEEYVPSNVKSYQAMDKPKWSDDDSSNTYQDLGRRFPPHRPEPLPPTPDQIKSGTPPPHGDRPIPVPPPESYLTPKELAEYVETQANEDDIYENTENVLPHQEDDVYEIPDDEAADDYTEVKDEDIPEYLDMSPH